MFNRVEKLMFDKGYTVDKYGRLFDKFGHEVIGSISDQGRRCTGVRLDNGKVRRVPFHRMIAYAKFGDDIYIDGMVVRHLDGNPLNNSWDNIEIGTASDNAMDIPRDRRVARSKNANVKYRDDVLEKIKTLIANGASYNVIMETTGITSKGTISYIVNNRI